MEDEIEIDLCLYYTAKIVKKVKIPISKLTPDEDGFYDKFQIEKFAYEEGVSLIKADGIKYFRIEIDEMDIVSAPDNFEYWD